MLMWSLQNHIDNVAVISETGEKLSYGDLQRSSEKLAKKITYRCLVLSLCTNCSGSLLGYVTFINNGIVPLMLDAQLDQQLLMNLTELYQPDYLWIPTDMQRDYGQYEPVYSDHRYTLLKTDYSKVYPLHKDLALLLTTSGSTGSRKLVRQSYANIKSNMETIAEYLEIDEAERSITTLPMSYTYGLSIINSYLHMGASLIMTEKTLVQKEFWQQFKDYATTSFGGVPYTYEMLNRLRFFRMELPSLRTLTQAGGRLLPELHKKFAEYARDTGKRFYVMYGQTEATARMSYLPYQQSIEKIGSVGIAIPKGKFSLIDVDEKEITEPDVTGELVYEGANVTLGYAQQGTDLAKGDEFGGRLITGDMAKVDSAGFYWIVGRKKRFIKIFGNRVNLDETEQLLKTKFESLEVACSGVDDKMYILITAPDLVDKVREYIINTTGLHHLAVAVASIDEIPKNEAGKIIYADVGKHSVD